MFVTVPKGANDAAHGRVFTLNREDGTFHCTPHQVSAPESLCWLRRTFRAHHLEDAAAEAAAQSPPEQQRNLKENKSISLGARALVHFWIHTQKIIDCENGLLVNRKKSYSISNNPKNKAFRSLNQNRFWQMEKNRPISLEINPRRVSTFLTLQSWRTKFVEFLMCRLETSSFSVV